MSQLIYREGSPIPLTWEEMDGNLNWLSANMSASTVVISGSEIYTHGTFVNRIHGTSSWSETSTTALTALTASYSLITEITSSTSASYVPVLAGDNITVNYEPNGIAISASFNTSNFIVNSQTSSMSVLSSSYSTTSSYVKVLAGENITVNYESNGIAISASSPTSFSNITVNGGMTYGGPFPTPIVRFYEPVSTLIPQNSTTIMWTGSHSEPYAYFDYYFITGSSGIGAFGNLTMGWNTVSTGSVIINDNRSLFNANPNVTWIGDNIGSNLVLKALNTSGLDYRLYLAPKTMTF